MVANASLARFVAYQKAMALFDLVVADLAPLNRRAELARLVGQQYASADSIASNIEEGYGRGSPKDYARFLVIARGSTQETAGRYSRLKHWLPESVITDRIALCNEIAAMLTGSINTLRKKSELEG